MAEQQKYVDIREGRISDVKSKLRKTASEEERYQLKNFLFNEYSSYVVDSALHYAQEKLVSAYKMNRQDYIDDSRLNMAYVLIQGGMYKEASDILQNIILNMVRFPRIQQDTKKMQVSSAITMHGSCVQKPLQVVATRHLTTIRESHQPIQKNTVRFIN